MISQDYVRTTILQCYYKAQQSTTATSLLFEIFEHDNDVHLIVHVKRCPASALLGWSWASKDIRLCTRPCDSGQNASCDPVNENGLSKAEQTKDDKGFQEKIRKGSKLIIYQPFTHRCVFPLLFTHFWWINIIFDIYIINITMSAMSLQLFIRWFRSSSLCWNHSSLAFSFRTWRPCALDSCCSCSTSPWGPPGTLQQVLSRPTRDMTRDNTSHHVATWPNRDTLMK